MTPYLIVPSPRRILTREPGLFAFRRESMRLTRREFLRTGAFAFSAGLPSIAGCGDNIPGGDVPESIACDEQFHAPGGGYQIAFFEITSSSAIVWVTAPTRTSVEIEISPAGVCAPNSLVRELEPAGAAWTGSVQLDDLSPGTAYDCVARFGDGGLIGPVKVRTAPSPDLEEDLTFLVMADIALTDDYSVLDVMRAHAPEFCLHLGDWPYADKAPRAVTVHDFHEKHRVARSGDPFDRFLIACPLYAIYDDHDVTDNWNGGTDTELVAAGVAAWRQWFPQRAVTQYRSWKWGALVEFFMLDTRLFRSPNDLPDGAEKTMLGAAQKAWFKDAISTSMATFKVVVTSVPLDFGNSSDSWTAFLVERDEILEFIRSEGVPGVVFLTADRHWFAAHHFADGMREYQFGPLTAGLGAPPSSFPPEVVAFHLQRNYGLIQITAGAAPQMTIECHNVLGEILFQETFGP